MIGSKAPGKDKNFGFSDAIKDELTDRLNKVGQLISISWEFTEDGLILDGINPHGEDRFRHPNSARAALDYYLAGYGHGFDDARDGEDEVEGYGEESPED